MSDLLTRCAIILHIGLSCAQDKEKKIEKSYIVLMHGSVLYVVFLLYIFSSVFAQNWGYYLNLTIQTHRKH